MNCTKWVIPARLDEVIDWTLFAAVFERIPRIEPKGPGGRPPFVPLIMFKAMVLQSLYQLSDGQLQFQVTDRLSFKRFLGFTDADKAPDEKAFGPSARRSRAMNWSSHSLLSSLRPSKPWGCLPAKARWWTPPLSTWRANAIIRP